MRFILKKNYFLLTIYFVYIAIGSYLSISNGITADEHHEQQNWQINSEAAINFIKYGSYEELLNYGDKYHGIGFHLISQPIQLILHNFVSNLNDISAFGGLLISKHFVVFLSFSISGIFFYLLCLKLTRNLGFSFISSALYLLYPYLFGHALLNPKDVPFLSFWLVNSYISLTIIESMFYENKIKISKIIALSFLTAFLISIRVLGLVIFLQYIISVVVLFNIKKIDINNFIKKNLSTFFVFIIFYFFLFLF